MPTVDAALNEYELCAWLYESAVLRRGIRRSRRLLLPCEPNDLDRRLLSERTGAKRDQ